MKHVNNIKMYTDFLVLLQSMHSQQTQRLSFDLVEAKCKEVGVNVALSEVWAKGGEGGLKLAEEVIRLCDEPNDFHYCYERKIQRSRRN